MLIKYINLPNIPEHLLEPYQDIVLKPAPEISGASKDYKYFVPKNVSVELLKWLKLVFHFEFVARYQLVYDGLHIHKDVGRLIAINYILENGGQNAETVLFDDNKVEICRENIKNKSWHNLIVGKYHTVQNIDTNSYRLAVSVTPVNQKDYLKNHYSPDELNELKIL